MSRSEADLADALAHFAVGILREGLADPGALANYERAIELTPDRLDLYLRAAAIHLRLGQAEAAIGVLHEACRRRPSSAEPRMYLAQIYQTLQRWEDARQAWMEAIRLDPADAMGYVQLALMRRELEDETGALELLEDAADKVKDPRPVLRLLGDLYIQRAGHISADNLTPDVQKAIQCYRRASRLPGDELTLPYLMQLGDVYLLIRQYQDAVDCFSEVAAREPDNLPAQKKLAFCFLALGDRERAVRHLKVIADQEPQNAEVQFTLGELYETLADGSNAVVRLTSACQEGAATPKMFLKLALLHLPADLSAASRVIEAGLEKTPDDLPLLELLAQLSLSAGDDAKARYSLGRLREVMARNPDRAQAVRRLAHYGTVAQQFQLRDAAADLFRQALALAPAQADLYSRLALLEAGRGREAEAIRIMEQANRLIPDHFTVNYVLGMLSGGAGRFPEALAAFSRAQDVALAGEGEPEMLDSGFYFGYGSVCERAGQWEQAEAFLRHAIVLDPGNSEALNYLAYMWAERGVNLEQALDLIRHALDEDPENGAYLDTLGWIYFKQGRLAEALDEIGNALYFLPDDSTIMEHYGEVLMALGRTDEARIWWLRGQASDAARAEELKALGVGRETPPSADPLPPPE